MPAGHPVRVSSEKKETKCEASLAHIISSYGYCLTLLLYEYLLHMLVCTFARLQTNIIMVLVLKSILEWNI